MATCTPTWVVDQRQTAPRDDDKPTYGSAIGPCGCERTTSGAPPRASSGSCQARLITIFRFQSRCM